MSFPPHRMFNVALPANKDGVIGCAKQIRLTEMQASEAPSRRRGASLASMSVKYRSLSAGDVTLDILQSEKCIYSSTLHSPLHTELYKQYTKSCIQCILYTKTADSAHHTVQAKPSDRRLPVSPGGQYLRNRLHKV